MSITVNVATIFPRGQLRPAVEHLPIPKVVGELHDVDVLTFVVMDTRERADGIIPVVTPEHVTLVSRMIHDHQNQRPVWVYEGRLSLDPLDLDPLDNTHSFSTARLEERLRDAIGPACISVKIHGSKDERSVHATVLIAPGS